MELVGCVVVQHTSFTFLVFILLLLQ